MSSSWTRERTAETRPVPRMHTRAQASPVAALVALFAVCAGVSLYATVLGGSIPAVDERTVAGPTIDRVHDAATDGGVTDPTALSDAARRGPDGYRLNVTLSVGDDEWTVGPVVPARATDRASRLASVRLEPGRVEPGRLSVVVWS